MQRFQRFLGRNVDFSRLRKLQVSTSADVTVRYLPDELEDFDELEFGAGSWEEQEVIFTLVLEQGKLARISLGYVSAGASEDDMRAFSETQLRDVLSEKGPVLESFFETVVPN